MRLSGGTIQISGASAKKTIIFLPLMNIIILALKLRPSRDSFWEYGNRDGHSDTVIQEFVNKRSQQGGVGQSTSTSKGEKRRKSRR